MHAPDGREFGGRRGRVYRGSVHATQRRLDLVRSETIVKISLYSVDAPHKNDTMHPKKESAHAYYGPVLCVYMYLNRQM